MNLFGGLPCVLPYILHLLVHISEGVYALADGECKASDGADAGDGSTLNLVKEVSRAVQPALLCSTLKANPLQLRPQQLCTLLHPLELFGTTRHLSQLFVDDLDGIFQVAHIRLGEITHGLLDQIRLTFHGAHIFRSHLYLLIISVYLMDDLLLFTLYLLDTCLHLLQLCNGCVVRCSAGLGVCHILFKDFLR